MNYFLYNNQFYPINSFVISAFDRGLTLGDGIFETLKISNGKPELWDAHIKRLSYGCSVFNFNIPDKNKLYDDVLSLIEKNTMRDAVLKIIITRHSLKRGLAFNNCSDTNILITMSELPPVPKYIKAIISPIRRNDTSPLSQVKSINYGDNLLAFNQAQKLGYDDAVMLNTGGQPCCFTIGNIVIETKDGQILTPPTSAGCLEGTFLTTFKNIQYQNFNLNDAVKIWRSNSLSGLVPVDLRF